MTHRAWVRLDNAANIFLAARSASDPKVFRLSAELDHEVDPHRLQRAVDATYDRYRLYHAVLRRGVFWYYLQDSDLRPVVSPEEQHPCAPLYQPDRRNLLFRVVHHRRRIVLEVFHALSDGTGALWFLTDLLTAYVRGDEGPAGDPDQIAKRPAASTHALSSDSFARYFRQAAVPAPLTVHPPSPDPAPGESGSGWRHQLWRRHPWRHRVHRIHGTRTPDNRPRVVELTVPAAEVLALARAAGVSLTMYVTALFFEAVRRSSPGLGRTRTLAASVPVNLRQFFPSTSPRNFFATIRVQHTYGEGADDLGSVCRQLDSQFRPRATPEALEQKLRRFIRFERSPALRVVPRPLKDVILRLVNDNSNRGLSIAVSNLGRVTLPAPAAAQVTRLLFHVSAARPQVCVISHAGLLTLSFTSPYVETDHVRELARLLTGQGLPVTVGAARVTEAELASGQARQDQR